MQLFSRLPERQVQLVRWSLLLGWLLLIASLLLPAFSLPAGNRLFWGTVVPSGVLLIGVFSHELWRRICPLAFVSQLARALGRQRSRPGRSGKPELVKVEAESWLGRHHLALQWTLLIAGLCLRLLAVNGSPLGLAILLLLTLAAALLVGWAWGGKAWCQYVCPMGPVQTVLTGLRGPLGSTAHVGTTATITQSMCRTVGPDGRERSACVACQAPCIDIDAERAYWQTAAGKRHLSWIWWSYPGLVLAFFVLMEWSGAGSGMETHPLGFLRSGAWALDADQPQRIGQSLWPWLWPASPPPRLLEIPLLLSAAAAASAALFARLDTLLQRLYQNQGLSDPRGRALLRTRLIATFVAINLFFWFVDPLQGVLGKPAHDLLQLLVLLATGITLYRSWSRDQATYRRESASESLRRQLRDLSGLEAALDGRSLDALSPQEVFTLVKAMPAISRRQGRATYRTVMGDMLRAGRLSGTGALLELQELRLALQLEEEDHHLVVRELALEQPALLEQDQRQRQIADLRQEAASEQIRDLLQLAGLEILDPEALTPALQRRLERLQRDIGLADPAWDALLQDFGPSGQAARRRLSQLQQEWIHEAALLSRLAELAAADPLLRPLRTVLHQRLEGLRCDLDPRLVAAGLNPLPAVVAPAGGLGEALDLLWSDPDPDTAGWVLMLARERDPQRAAHYLQSGRTGLADSPFLASQRRGETDPDREEYPFITATDLFAELPPADLLWVARHGVLQDHDGGAPVISRGAVSDSVAVVVRGELSLQLATGQQRQLGVGQSVGERGVITGEPRSTTVHAGPGGARLFVLPAEAFEQLLRRSHSFNRALLAQLAERMLPPAVDSAPRTD